MDRQHKWRKFDRNNQEDLKLVLKLLTESGSKSCNKEKNIVRTALFRTKEHPEKLVCEIVDNIAFYMHTVCKDSVRGLFTIVHKDYHSQGYGQLLNKRRFDVMKSMGIYKFRFRTNMNEPAQKFWLKQGATIIGINGNDFEMEINIK